MRLIQKGFTLIELMIVVAIIGMLAAIAIPAYSSYVKKSTESSCQTEMKGYANKVLMQVSNGEGIPAPVVGACATINTPATGTSVFTATTRTPGTKGVSCNLASGGTCTMTGT